MVDRVPRPWSRNGFSVLEVLIVVGVLGVLAGLVFALLPRQTMAVNQGQRLLSTAVQFARFEAIRSNEPVVVEFEAGSTEVIVRWARDAADGGRRVLRTVSLNPQDGRVLIKGEGLVLEFNSRGMAGTVSQPVEIGIMGTPAYDVRLEISPLGAIARAGDG